MKNVLHITWTLPPYAPAETPPTWLHVRSVNPYFGLKLTAPKSPMVTGSKPSKNKISRQASHNLRDAIEQAKPKQHWQRPVCCSSRIYSMGHDPRSCQVHQGCHAGPPWELTNYATYLRAKGVYVLDEGAPNCWISFTAASMYILDPLDRLAYATAAPIKRCYTDIASLPFPFTICGVCIRNKGKAEDKYVNETSFSMTKQTWWGSAAHVPFINVINFQTNEPWSKRYVFICIFVQDRPNKDCLHC